MTDANDELIFAEEYKRLNSNLMIDSTLVDKKVIAKLCNMTEEEFVRQYHLVHQESQRVFGEWALMYAEFEERKEELTTDDEDYEYVPSIFDVSCYTTGQLDTVCNLIGLNNPISDKWELPISTITKEELAELELLQELIPIGWAEIKWEEDDAYDYYRECYQEALGGLNALINSVKNEK